MNLQGIKCGVAFLAGKIGRYVVKAGRGMGRSFPGYVFLKIGGLDCLSELAAKSKIGNILITGTNGKTTTTKMLCLLLEKDSLVSCNFESNTVNAVATGLLGGEADLGIFEYGIRTAKYSMPDLICKLVDPIGVIYTTISKEHAIVAGQENPFKEYFKAKMLLSDPMKKGIIISNADDPRTAYIGMKKERDTHVTYYGFDANLEDKTPMDPEVSCPICERKLDYSRRYLGHRGIYKCECGFKRPEPDVKLTGVSEKDDKWRIKILGDVYNYTTQGDVILESHVDIPVFGVHNIYNFLCALTAYLSFTPNPENKEEVLKRVSKEPETFTLPRGRFEILKIKPRIIVDYAHNPDGVRAIMQFLKHEKGQGKLVVVNTIASESGVEGDREIASILSEADVVIPASYAARKASDFIKSQVINIESSKKETKSGTLGASKEQVKEAIKIALENLEDKDTLLIIGEGGYKYGKGVIKEFIN